MINYSEYSIIRKNISKMKKAEVDADPRAIYWRQLRNGVY